MPKDLASHEEKVIMLESHYYTDLVEAGCDEAGRGCLAGSVYAAAVILPADYQNAGLNDSKKLSPKKRYALREQIQRDAVAWAVGIVTPDEIDKINILNASILAMHRALDQLKVRPEAIIVDGNRFKSYHMYDWKSNKGYPTKKHREGIRMYGISPYHRRTFQLLGDGQLSLDFKDDTR